MSNGNNNNGNLLNLNNGHSGNGGCNGVLEPKNPVPFRRESLPIDLVRRRITALLKKSLAAIFIGETGSGKSTQIPQLCIEAGLTDDGGMIGVTQPRKVAARALAQRVAEEMNCQVGEKVGFKFRFEDNVHASTKLAYLTDGILLREALHDCCLSRYSVVIVDEAHERSVNTDVLLYILKLAQQEREKAGRPLRVFLMSATMDSEKFSRYFGGIPVYFIRGRAHPVEMFCTENTEDDDYLFNAVSAVIQLHRTESIDHGFLVFLTGQEEIDAACRMTLRAAKEMKHRIVATPLYSSVTASLQARCFQPAPSNSRKVIFATNIAETSLTIPGIRVVIDSGKVKQKSFTSLNGVDVLKVVNISKAQAIQRAGRAGREARGKCYRLYSQADFDKFPDSQEPEILRMNLSSVLLDLAKMGLKRARELRLIDPPRSELVDAAVDELRALGAFEVKKNGKFFMTDLGHELVKFPIDPKHAMILASARRANCLDEALTVVAFLSAESVFTTTLANDTSASVATSTTDRTAAFDANEGDHIRFLKIYRTFRTQTRNNKNSLKV